MTISPAIAARTALAVVGVAAARAAAVLTASSLPAGVEVTAACMAAACHVRTCMHQLQNFIFLKLLIIKQVPNHN
jgi:hypothetical protein